LALQSVIADRRSRIERAFHVSLFEDCALSR
jgi:hypothetical protein